MKTVAANKALDLGNDTTELAMLCASNCAS
jgi:hypothetical protein